jgi:tRNA A37 threonylcarbamoyladenosine biosynthesis protein TsaE
MDDPHNLVLIEWGERFPRLVRERDFEIAIDRVSEEERRVMVTEK